jgi:phosphopantothenate---cysteine ligase (CTP)
MASKPHFLVTAGPTREKIDEVRDWGNIFTGGTGLDVALALLDLGDVTLLTSNAAHAGQYDGFYGKGGMLGAEVFSTHAELLELLDERMTSGDRVDAVAMSAAVADYRPVGSYRVLRRETSADGGRELWTVENVSAPKVKSTYGQIAVLGEATVKLVDLFRTQWKFTGVLVKFKLEVGIGEEELVRVAGQSREASGADLMVANTLEMVRGIGGRGGGEAGAYFIDAAGAVRVTRAKLAGELRDRIAVLLKSRAAG